MRNLTYFFIRHEYERIEVTTAKVHDSQVDLANEGEVRYADKGLFRCEDKRVRCCHEKSHKGPSPKL